MEKEIELVFCTVPDAQTGKTIAETLVKEGLCACVNRVSGLASHYIYEGEYCEDAEELLLIKTTGASFERLKSRIETLHPYEVPEIIATKIVAGNESYLAWVRNSVS
jgi:periplasmic divalent cation tolerance protein